ncbi:MAG: histidinol-phosphate transaminase [Rickettsiales bacterium]
MYPKAHKYLLDINNYVPGKSQAKSKNKNIIKLSSNENALGASPKALIKYIEHAKDVFRYADGSCTNLREKLAQKNQIDANKIVCGAGSDEILALITSAFASVDDEIIYTEHGFLMYPISAQRVGAKAIKVLEKNLKTDIDNILNAITQKTKIIFLANPNNPTGSYLNKNEILELITKIPSNILLVLDHAYEEYVDVDDYYNGFEIVDKFPNVILTRTFSKIYGLASLRIGWSYSSLEIANILNKVRGPFNVSGPAQISALYALDDDDFTLASKQHNSKWLKIFADEFKQIANLQAYPSIANFILIDFFSAINAQKINQELLNEGIILREVAGYGLPSFLRLSIGKDEENYIVLDHLKKLLKC